jgi:hypothetical protein
VIRESGPDHIALPHRLLCSRSSKRSLASCAHQLREVIFRQSIA